MPKFLVPVGGQPMAARLIDLYREYVARAVLVVHPDFAGETRRRFDASPIPIEIAEQSSATGMLDAVLLARDAVSHADANRVWITWCDQVAIHPRTVARLGELSDTHPDAAIVLPTAVRGGPYIHFERDDEGGICRVLQRREGDSMPDVGESDAGLFSLSREAFLDLLPEYAMSVATGTSTGERNLLPFIPWAAQRAPVIAFPVVEEMEAVGINTPEELHRVEAYLAQRDRARS